MQSQNRLLTPLLPIFAISQHFNFSLKKITVFIGTSELEKGGKSYESTDLHIHPNYDPSEISNDVAIIKLSEPMDLDGVKAKAVKLVASGTETQAGTKILVSGWGTISVSMTYITLGAIFQLNNLPYIKRHTNQGEVHQKPFHNEQMKSLAISLRFNLKCLTDFKV